MRLLAINSNVLAVPIAVDSYQDMESGNNGDVLTAAVMNASSHPSSFSWTNSNSCWVSTSHHSDLPGPVIVGGVTYNGTGGTRSWKFNHNNQGVFVKGSFVSQANAVPLFTIGYYFASNSGQNNTGYNTVEAMSVGGSFLIMQTINSDGFGPYIRPHSYYAGASNHGSVLFQITSAKTYWVNLHYDRSISQNPMAVFDPANGFAQVGSTSTCKTNQVVYYGVEIGRCENDQHGNATGDPSNCWVNHLMVDYTNGTFPLLPSGANDTTAPPAPPVVRDGTSDDASIALSTTQLSANWDMPWDAESGIKGYQYAIGTTQGGTNVVNWTSLPNQLGITKTGLSLTTGQTYYFGVKAINGVGLTGPATNSNGQTVGTDTTPPSAPPAVRDGGAYDVPSPDIDYNGNPHELEANFDLATDPESGISGYQYCIGTTPGGTNTVNWTNLGNFGSVVTLSDPNPPNGVPVGVRYYVTVRAMNNAGIVGPATSSNGQVVANTSDTTPPSNPPAVRDGTGSTETSTTTSTTQLSANWDNSTDNESGIQCYYYRIGTTPGGNNVLGDTKANYDSPVSHVTVTGLSLTIGQTYYFGVHATNGAWLGSGTTNSSGITVVSSSDTTPPSAPPNVRDGTGADISTTSSTTQLSANWDASTDNESGISGYQYAIGTSAGGTQTVNFTSLGNVTTVTKTGLTLSVGQTYFFSVKAVNGVGLTGSATNSNGQTVVDVTPPNAPANVRDGTGTDISTTNSTTQLSANWDAATDAESGISGYQYAIGTSAGGTQTVNWTSLGNVTTVTKTGLTLSVGQTYYFSVKAVNGAGLTGSATNSNGQTVVAVSNTVYFQDNFENWTVHGGAWSSVNGESSTHTLNTSTDYAMAGSKCLKITDTDTTATTGASLTKNFSPVISGDIYVRFFVFLPTGFGSANSTCVRRIVRLYMNAGNYTLITLVGDGLSISEVGGWSGTGQTAISENAWHCVELHVAPPSASTAIQYWIDGTSAGTCTGAYSGNSTFNYMMFGDVALATSGTTNGTGTIYWDEVIVANYYIDPSAPSSPANVRDGTGADISTTSSTTQLSANWDAATDADSGISGYQYAIGTSAGGTQTLNWTSLGNVTTVTQTGLTLTVGQTYYVSVRAVNGAGLNSAGTSSNGQTVVVAPVTYFSDTFDSWSVHGGAWSSTSGETSTHTLNTSTDQARAGTKSLKLTDTDTTAVYGACLVKNFSPTISGDIYVRFYVFLPTGYASTNTNCTRRVIRIWCGTNRGQMSIVYNEEVSIDEVGGWNGVQSTTALTENAWHCLEIHMGTPSSSTPMQFWIDGTSAGTLNGSFAGSTVYTYMEFGDVLIWTGGSNGTATFYLDEVVVSNVYNGPLP